MKSFREYFKETYGEEYPGVRLGETTHMQFERLADCFAEYVTVLSLNAKFEAHREFIEPRTPPPPPPRADPSVSLWHGFNIEDLSHEGLLIAYRSMMTDYRKLQLRRRAI